MHQNIDNVSLGGTKKSSKNVWRLPFFVGVGWRASSEAVINAHLDF
jgi:hypothetical protein